MTILRSVDDGQWDTVDRSSSKLFLGQACPKAVTE